MYVGTHIHHPLWEAGSHMANDEGTPRWNRLPLTVAMLGHLTSQPTVKGAFLRFLAARTGIFRPGWHRGAPYNVRSRDRCG